MKVNVLFFGMLIEKAGGSTVIVENVQNLSELKFKLETQYSFLDEMNYLVAVNQEVVQDNIELNENDEIALLPPYAGGWSYTNRE